MDRPTFRCRRVFAAWSVLGLMMAGLPFGATAQDTYPSRPIKLIVGFAPGGGVDISARLIGEWLSPRLGQSFIVENRSGADGTKDIKIALCPCWRPRQRDGFLSVRIRHPDQHRCVSSPKPRTVADNAPYLHATLAASHAQPVRPWSLLRIDDDAERRSAYLRFVADLKAAARLAVASRKRYANVTRPLVRRPCVARLSPYRLAQELPRFAACD